VGGSTHGFIQGSIQERGMVPAFLLLLPTILDGMRTAKKGGLMTIDLEETRRLQRHLDRALSPSEARRTLAERPVVQIPNPKDPEQTIDYCVVCKSNNELHHPNYLTREDARRFRDAAKLMVQHLESLYQLNFETTFSNKDIPS
jgi:hypothetical protein